MIVLGIETSCDETGVAVFDSERGLRAQSIFSQAPLHGDFGGVVPELASRDHIKRVLPMIRQVTDVAGIGISEIGGVAYTAGPGLIGALLVGVAIGRSLAYSLRVPALAVHHMEAHLLAVLLEQPSLPYPFLALLVSGGHTQLLEVAGLGNYRLLGESLDDAAGEAFDKTAKLLGLGYPGGPEISQLAERGTAGRFRFPRPMTDRPGLDFSFSGLKTHAARVIETAVLDEQTRADIAHAFVDAVVDTLVIKCERAMTETGVNVFVVAGGVSANRQLRDRLTRAITDRGGQVHYPAPGLCTDNGAMVAYAGYLHLAQGASEPLSFGARARWPLAQVIPVST